MKQALVVLSVIALFAVPANATSFRLFFSTQGVGEFDPLGSVVPTFTNPVVSGSARLYIWAETPAPTPQTNYIAVGYNISATGGAAITGGLAYNDFYTGTTGSGGSVTTYRWQGYNNGTLAANFLGNVRLASPPAGYYGVRNGPQGLIPVDPHLYSDGQAGGHRDVLLGYVDVTGTAGSLFFQVGDLGIIRAAATWEPVYFGFGDEGAGLMGNSKQQGSPVADATFVPEPASLLLLGLAGLALRRR